MRIQVFPILEGQEDEAEDGAAEELVESQSDIVVAYCPLKTQRLNRQLVGRNVDLLPVE